MAEENTDAQEQTPAPETASDAAPPARQTRQRAVDVPDDAEPDEQGEQAPRVWLLYNPKSGRVLNHVPTQGSGAGGELTPDEVQAYIPTRALYKDVTGRGPDGKQEPMYTRVRKAELRAPHAAWEATRAPQEVKPNGES